MGRKSCDYSDFLPYIFFLQSMMILLVKMKFFEESEKKEMKGK
jgi:hypothetical protein